jgi:tRNA G26 N,N-dimethylase Trm1
MIKMKNVLTENMRRFGTKNLKENIKTDSELNRIVKKIQDEASRGENQTDMILAELGDFYTEIYDSGDTELIRLYNQLRMSADETPDIQRYAASKLVKYLDKNLNEQ